MAEFCCCFIVAIGYYVKRSECTVGTCIPCNGAKCKNKLGVSRGNIRTSISYSTPNLAAGSCEKSQSTLCRKSWVFSRRYGFLPQGKLTGWVRINTVKKVISQLL